jgi:hypothetical protein
VHIKTAYRQKNNSVEDIPTEELPPIEALPSDEPPAMEAAEVETPQPESDPVAEAEHRAALADEAAAALKAQVEAARQAERFQAQRQQAAMMAQRPLSREEKLESWGLTEVEKKFLIDNPAMLDHDAVLAAAIATTTRAGIDRSAPGFLDAVERNFSAHFAHFQKQAAAQSPEFFRPPPVAEPSRPTPASYTSAPVSREAPGGDRPPSIPTRITLTWEEKEAAKIAGVSELEYAHQKRRLLLEKAQGHRQT